MRRHAAVTLTSPSSCNKSKTNRIDRALISIGYFFAAGMGSTLS